MEEKTYVVKISGTFNVKTTTEVSARRVATDNVLLPLRNTSGGDKFDIESITIKEENKND